MSTIVPESKGDNSMTYNNYSTKQTIGNGCLTFSLITSNAMQIRTLSDQKQRDSIWTASLALVIFSLVAQIVLAGILIAVGKGDIEDSRNHKGLKMYNNFGLFLIVLITMVNVVINVFMSTTDPKSFIVS